MGSRVGSRFGEERTRKIKSSLVRRRSALSQGGGNEVARDRTQPEDHHQEKRSLEGDGICVITNRALPECWCQESQGQIAGTVPDNMLRLQVV